MNPFEVLGISQSATLEDVKVAWRRKAHLHHPDKGGDANAFAECRKAYEMVDSEEKLAYYRNPRVDLSRLMAEQGMVYDAVRAAMRRNSASTGIHFGSHADTSFGEVFDDIFDGITK